LKHYRQATILSDEARRAFVPPDLSPLPILAVVRDALASDAEAIARIYAPYVAKTAISFELVPPDASEMIRRLLEYQETHPWLVATVDGGVIAYAYASPYRTRPAYRWSTEVSVYTDADVHRRGAGRMLYESLLAELTSLGYRQAIAGIALPNDASVRFHEALGFETSGVMRRVGFKLGAWHDVGFWQLALGGDGLPNEPPFARASQPAKSAQ
jgi:phosphinothricin acetyltransferase